MKETGFFAEVDFKRNEKGDKRRPYKKPQRDKGGSGVQPERRPVRRGRRHQPIRIGH